MDAAGWLLVLTGFGLGVLVGLWLAQRAPKGAQPPPAPYVPPNTPPVMAEALRRAPELFAEARRVAAMQKVVACVTCGQPTVIVCPTCGARVCMAHQEDHGCGGDGKP